MGKKHSTAAQGLEEFLLPRRIERIESVLEQRTDCLTLILDNVHNPHNISAVIRSADAFGLTHLHLVGENFEYSRGISLGAERWIQISKHKTPKEALQRLQEEEFELAVLAPKDRENSIPVYKLPFQKKLALVFGNEHRGVSKEFEDAATLFAHIPMMGFVESLNISVAAAITLFCSSVSGISEERRTPPLTNKAQKILKTAWLRKDIRGADAILKRIDKEE